MRRMSGIWPPSKPMRMELPERAVWPLPPRPAGFAVAAGFALAEPFAAVFRAGTGFKIV
jgi:hypothetical protein